MVQRPKIQTPEMSGLMMVVICEKRGCQRGAEAGSRERGTHPAVRCFAELLVWYTIRHEGKRGLGSDSKVGWRERCRRDDVPEPGCDGAGLEELDLRPRLAVDGVGHDRVKNREVAEGGGADGKVDRDSSLFRRLGDAFEWGDGVGRGERCRSAARGNSNLGVATDDGDGLDGGGEGK